MLCAGYLIAFAGVKYFNNQRVATSKSAADAPPDAKGTPVAASSKDELEPLANHGSFVRSTDDHDSDDTPAESQVLLESSSERLGRSR